MSDNKTPAPVADAQKVAEGIGGFITKEIHDKRFKQTILWFGSLILALAVLFIGYEKLVTEPAQQKLVAQSQQVLQDAKNTQALTQALADTWKSQNKTYATTFDNNLKAAGFTKSTDGGNK